MALQSTDEKVDLVLNRMTKSVYNSLQEEGLVADNELYFIVDDDLDADDKQIVNVADPIKETDAANKRYVDSAVSSATSLRISEDGGKTFQKSDEILLINIDSEKYHRLVKTGQTLSNAIYEVSYDNEDCFGERVINVGDPIDDTDAATKGYVDSEIQKIDVSSQLTGYARKNNISVSYNASTKKIVLDADGRTSEIDATAFVKDGMISNATYSPLTKNIVLTFNTDSGKTPISVDVSDLVDAGITVEMHDVNNGIDVQLSSLKLYKVTEQEYKDAMSVYTPQELSNALFDVAYDQVDAMNQPVKNVGTPVADSDAATKEYVDSKVPTQVSELNNNAGYLTEASLAGYLNATHVSPILTEGTEIATIGGKTIFAPAGGGGGGSGSGGGGGVALAPCIIKLKRWGSYDSGSKTIGGITINTTYSGGEYAINGETVYTGDADLTFVIYVPTDDPYANTTQIFESGSCLKYDTLITMADGTRKEIVYLKVGDKILSINPETHELEEDEVIIAETSPDRTVDSYDIWEFDDGTKIETVNRHRFYNNELNEFMYLEAWKNGETAVNSNKVGCRLVKHEVMNEKTQHCTIFTKKFNNYFANGLLSGNRHSTEFGKALI